MYLIIMRKIGGLNGCSDALFCFFILFYFVISVPQVTSRAWFRDNCVPSVILLKWYYGILNNVLKLVCWPRQSIF